jgi:hypothetical protein
MLAEALQHMRQAIELLDQADAPAQIAAHVDLAVHQLLDSIGPQQGEGLPSERSSARH